jgi:hypothetical protein
MPRGSSSSSRSAKSAPASGPSVKAPAPGGIAVRETPAGTPTTYSAPKTTSPSRATVVVGGGNGTIAGGRDRGEQPVAGFAVPRPYGDVVSFPLFGPWGFWYPWFGGGLGWNAGYVNYNPWSYGAACWGFGRYGFWYDPWLYSWDPYYSSGYYSGAPASTKPAPTTGDLRIKANLAEAKVYVDGALAGIVDDFDGLSDHLELDRGRHVVELRAEGYETVSKEVNVTAGKTQTLRLSLKKQKN